jgi:hypothetical protein
MREFSQKKRLKRTECTWLAFQIAYLQALQQVIDQEVSLQKPWLDPAIITLFWGQERQCNQRAIAQNFFTHILHLTVQTQTT